MAETMLENRLTESLREALGEGFARKRYLLAVSGGLDSMVLWALWHKALPEVSHAVAHFHHGVRPEADEDEALVRRQADRWRTPVHVGRRPPGEPASEAALRQARYGFLEAVLTEARCDYLVTAHHAQDQWETWAMRLLRGTGVDGLGAMRVVQEKRVRPLLRVSRTELEAYARAQRISYREDATNALPRYLRNRVRATLWPAWRELSGEFGGEGAFLSRFGALVEELQWASDALEAQTEQHWNHCCHRIPGGVRVERRALEGLSEPWRLRLLRRVGRELGVGALDRKDWRRVWGELQHGAPRAHAGQGLALRQSCGWVFFQRGPAPPGTLQVWDTGFRCEPMGLEFAVDPGWLGELTVRFARPGDRLGSRKLKRWLLERRIPAPERPWLPVLAVPHSPQVVWVYPQPHPRVSLVGVRTPFSFSRS